MGQTADDTAQNAFSATVSPYLSFSEDEWRKLRQDTPMTLSETEIHALESLNDPVSAEQVETIYLPLCRLLFLYVQAMTDLHGATRRFLGKEERKTPFVIGIAGSVAVGKSTTARLLQALLSRWPENPSVDLVTTDGFLFSNSQLEQAKLMKRKGFPESYDRAALLRFIADVKAGRTPLFVPIYSHLSYDIMQGESQKIEAPDILILEGLNVLQPAKLPREGNAVPFVSDFFDFSIYIDADEHILRNWYLDRFLKLRETAFRDPASYFHRYSQLDDYSARQTALALWQDINLVNLQQNIFPTRPRASLILTKRSDHNITRVDLRKI